jgi:hypothetical protein
MSDGAEDDGDASEELGETADKIGGIADRFNQSGEASEASETTETSEASETTEAVGTTEATETSETTYTTDASAETAGGEGQTSSEVETTETSEATEASETTSLPGDDVVVREDWNGRTIYLSDDLVDEVEDAYGRYYGAFRSEHGRELKKNRDLYPAIFRSALRETSMEEELGLVDEADGAVDGE